MTSVLELIKQNTDKKAKQQAEDAQRIANVTVPELAITEDAAKIIRGKWFPKIGPAVAELVAKELGVTQVSVPLLALEDKPYVHYGELHGSNFVTDWTSRCALRWFQLSNGWHFDASKNSARARASFMSQYHARLTDFVSRLRALWIEFDRSLLPKITYVFPKNYGVRYTSAEEWIATENRDVLQLCTYVPNFIFTFDWSEEAPVAEVVEEPPPRPVKKSKTEDDEGTTECAICQDSEINCCFGCGHGTCQPCAQKLSTCPTCRAPITQKIKLFF
jgi:hypothetical protein